MMAPAYEAGDGAENRRCYAAAQLRWRSSVLRRCLGLFQLSSQLQPLLFVAFFVGVELSAL